jgi:iron(III) transport system permease protein
VSATASAVTSRLAAGRGIARACAVPRLATLTLAAAVATPLVVVGLSWTSVQTEVWQHLASTVLPDLVRNTVVLMAGVGAGTLVLGTGLAWLTVMYEFPGRRLFEWALVLPLAVPAYVLAFVAIGLLDFAGPVQGFLRTVLGPGRLGFPEIRSEGGVVAVMVLALYPYVYLLARAAFLAQGRSTLDAARTLGLSSRAAFFRVALPMARPAIAAGTVLALMETLADFGAVSAFNYDTFTTAIYKAWFGLFNLQAAAQLATLLLLFVALALLAERRTRGRGRYHSSGRRAAEERRRLGGARGWAATATAGGVLALGFLIPVAQLLLWAWGSLAADLDMRYLGLLGHTVLLAGGAALVTVTGAFLLGFTARYCPSPLVGLVVRAGTLGYALPGSVLAVGVMLSFTWLDRTLAGPLAEWLGHAAGPVLSGSLAGLLLAYLVRFLAVAFGPVDSAIEQLRPSLRDAARSLGASRARIVRRVYLPILRPGLLAATLLAFVEVMKEMPATLLLRPFGWDTLAVRVFELTSEGEWERAALPAVVLVLVGLVPVAMLVRREDLSP